jgi:hypothetical protein
VIELSCHRVLFYAPGDEGAFFRWVNSIDGVQGVVGIGEEIRFRVPRVVPDATLRELLAVFFRYQIDMTQLAQFVLPSNQSWFMAPNTYWHNHVFPTPN